MFDLPQRARFHHHPPHWIPNDSRFFITVCCLERHKPSLTKPLEFRTMTNAVERYAWSGKWHTDLFLAMPDHWHAIIQFQNVDKMDKTLRDWKRYIAKHTGIEWQDGFFDHRLRTGQSAREKWDYILLNPVRKQLVQSPEDWPFVWTPHDAAAAR